MIPLLLLSFCCLSQDNSLIVGGGDNNIHVMDLEQGNFKVCDVFRCSAPTAHEIPLGKSLGRCIPDKEKARVLIKFWGELWEFQRSLQMGHLTGI